MLRAELTGVYVWTLPVNGAGYFRYPGYDADARDELKKEDLAEQAAGYNLGLSATLRARMGPDDGAGLIVLDSFLAEHWALGDGPYYANLRRDVLMAASDWVLKNTGVVLGDTPLGPLSRRRGPRSRRHRRCGASGRDAETLRAFSMFALDSRSRIPHHSFQRYLRLQ